jgi:hypothetical protein
MSNPPQNKPTDKRTNYTNNNTNVQNTIHIQSPPYKILEPIKTNKNETKPFINAKDKINPDSQKPQLLQPSQQPQINAPNSVISINQQGGITAHTVNLAPQDRHITSEQRAIIINMLKANTLPSVTISYGVADPEQKQFAEELITVLREAGCVLEISSAIHMVTPYEKGLTFEVNKTPPYPKGSDFLQKALNNAYVDSYWVATPDIKRDMIWMVVGKK